MINMATIHQFIKFAIIGILAAATHLSVLTLFIEIAHIHALAANAMAFLCAFTVSYLGQCFWTFQSREPALSKYLFVALFAISLSELGLYMLHYKYGIHYQSAILMTYTIIPLGTFMLNKYWVFK